MLTLIQKVNQDDLEKKLSNFSMYVSLSYIKGRTPNCRLYYVLQHFLLDGCRIVVIAVHWLQMLHESLHRVQFNNLYFNNSFDKLAEGYAFHITCHTPFDDEMHFIVDADAHCTV